VGGLAHYLEGGGLATTQISLIREHSERMRPPRALWVPFELGRPLGAPDDAAFQSRVVMAALDLLGAEEGPVLADFPEEAPEADAITGWACPINLAPPRDEAETAAQRLDAAFADEIERLRPWHDLAVEALGRTMVGASGLDIIEAGRFIAACLEPELPASPLPELSPTEVLRLACDDVKAFYLEAAAAQPGQATSRDLAEWFWGETAAAKVIIALRALCVESEDKGLRALIGILVPRAQLHRMDG
jgi:hypothetical protein